MFFLRMVFFPPPKVPMFFPNPVKDSFHTLILVPVPTKGVNSGPKQNKTLNPQILRCKSNILATLVNTRLLKILKTYRFTFSMWHCKSISHKSISHIQVWSYLFFQPAHGLKLGLQIDGRLLIATHLDQSKYPGNHKQGAVNKYDLTVFIRLFQGSCSAMKAVHFFWVPILLQWIHWI